MDPTRFNLNPAIAPISSQPDVVMGEVDQATQKAAKRTFEEIASTDDPLPLRQKPRLDQIRNLIEQFENGNEESIEEIFKLATPEILQDLAGWFIVSATENDSRYNHLFGAKPPTVEFIEACCSHSKFRYNLTLFAELLKEIMVCREVDYLVPLLFHPCVKQFEPPVFLALHHLFAELVIHHSNMVFFKAFTEALLSGLTPLTKDNAALVQWIESYQAILSPKEYSEFLYELSEECPSLLSIFPLLFHKLPPTPATSWDVRVRLILLLHTPDRSAEQKESEVQTLIPLLCHAKDLFAFHFMAKFGCISWPAFANLQKSLIAEADLFLLFNLNLEQILNGDLQSLCLERLLTKKTNPKILLQLLLNRGLYRHLTALFRYNLPSEVITKFKEWFTQIQCTKEEYATIFSFLVEYTAFPVLLPCLPHMEGELCLEEIRLLDRAYRVWGKRISTQKRVTFASFATAETSVQMLLQRTFPNSFKDCPSVRVSANITEDLMGLTLFAADRGLKKFQWSPGLEENFINLCDNALKNTSTFVPASILFGCMLEWTPDRTRLQLLFDQLITCFEAYHLFQPNETRTLMFLTLVVEIIKIEPSFIRNIRLDFSGYLKLLLCPTTLPTQQAQTLCFASYLAKVNPSLFRKNNLFSILQTFFAQPLSQAMLLKVNSPLIDLENLYRFKLPLLLSKNPIPRLQQREQRGGRY